MDAAEEDPFDLIRRGNAHESASDHWRAAECYGRASECLRIRADALSSQMRRHGDDGGGDAIDPKAIAEKRRVVSLFRAQSLEYMYKARHSLLEALRFENEQDRARTVEVARSGSGSLDPLCSLIDVAEGARRRRIFEALFSGGGLDDAVDAGSTSDGSVHSSREKMEQNAAAEDNAPETAADSAIGDAVPPKPDTDESNTEATHASPDEIDDRTQSIESRLAQLDSTLLPKVPPPFVSGSRTNNGGNDDKNRLAEIRRGLGRLGVTLPPEAKKSDILPENLSAEDQAKLIIQQAQDEVRMERGRNGVEGSESNGLVDTEIDENDSMFDGFDDFEDDGMDIDALLSKAETLVARTGLEASRDGKVAPELAQIRKAQALLLEARLCLEMANPKSSDEQKIPNGSEQTGSDDDSEDSDNSNLDGDASKVAARKKARGLIENAQGCMKQLLTDWK